MRSPLRRLSAAEGEKVERKSMPDWAEPMLARLTHHYFSGEKLLKAATRWDDPLRWTPYRNGDGLAYYRQACRRGWEGIIAKQAASGYINGRSNKWLKFKCIRQQEFVVGGFTEPHGERVGFGALLLGFYRGGELVYAGRGRHRFRRGNPRESPQTAEAA